MGGQPGGLQQPQEIPCAKLELWMKTWALLKQTEWQKPCHALMCMMQSCGVVSLGGFCGHCHLHHLHVLLTTLPALASTTKLMRGWHGLCVHAPGQQNLFMPLEAKHHRHC